MNELLAGFELVTTLPEGEACVSTVVFKDNLIVATTRGVFMLVDDKLLPIPFVWEMVDAALSEDVK